MMKKLGLDLGSSSIGWALREDDKFEKKGAITFDTGMKKGGLPRLRCFHNGIILIVICFRNQK
jgi:CRISPR/Cas system Type II protein with McrA/HNH and RuvC-like nuclease domain